MAHVVCRTGVIFCFHKQDKLIDIRCVSIVLVLVWDTGCDG